MFKKVLLLCPQGSNIEGEGECLKVEQTEGGGGDSDFIQFSQ